MTDPLSLGAGAAGKIGSAVAASYARGRDERRRAYQRFQDAVVSYVMHIRDSRISPEAMGLSPDQRKPYVDALMQATKELAQALYEVRLVGNPGPREAAETLREAVGNSFDAAAARRGTLTTDEVAGYTRAMQAFTEVCRRDLWYEPPWWQFWRPSWWQARRRRATVPVLVPPTPYRAPLSMYSQATLPVHDVVFGVEKYVNRAGQAIGAVMGSAIQTNDVHGVVFHEPSPYPGRETDTVKPPPMQPQAWDYAPAADDIPSCGNAGADDPDGPDEEPLSSGEAEDGEVGGVGSIR